VPYSDLGNRKLIELGCCNSVQLQVITGDCVNRTHYSHSLLIDDRLHTSTRVECDEFWV